MDDQAPRELSLLLTIQPEVFEATICKIIFHDCHEGGHLAEEQHFMVGGTEFGKNSVEKFKFTRGSVEIQSSAGPGGE